jgi:hypothetical protein
MIIACRCACQNHKMMMAVHHGTPMCLLKTHDGIMIMCLWNSQDYAMSMFRLSTSHDDACRRVNRVARRRMWAHKMMTACRCSVKPARWMIAIVQKKAHFEVYAPQTKILEGRTKGEMRISKEALFKFVSTRFGLRIVEISIENPHFIFLFLLPKFSFGDHKLSLLLSRIG